MHLNSITHRSDFHSCADNRDQWSIDSFGVWITSSKKKFKALQKRQTNLRNDEEKVSHDVAWLAIYLTLNETTNQEASMQENIYKYSPHIVPALFPFYQKIFLSAILYRLHNSWLMLNAAWTLKWWHAILYPWTNSEEDSLWFCLHD